MSASSAVAMVVVLVWRNKFDVATGASGVKVCLISRIAERIASGVALGLICYLAVQTPTAAQGIEDLCVVRVGNTDPGPSESESGYYLGRNVHTLPGVAWPIVFRSLSPFRMDEEYTLTRMTGEWPQGVGSLSIRFAPGDTAGSVIGTGGLGVYRLDPGNTEFRQIAAYKRDEKKSYTGVVRVDRMKATIVGGSEGLFAVADNALRPLPITANVPPLVISNLTDLPILGAIAWGSAQGNVQIRWDSGLLEEVKAPQPFLYLRGIQELSDPAVLILQFDKMTTVLPVQGTPGDRRLSTIRPTPRPDDRGGWLSKLLGQYLVSPSPPNSGPLRRLGVNGLEDVPGATFSRSTMSDVSAIGAVLIQAHEGKFIYDGQRVTPFPTEKEVGDYRTVWDLPSIERTFMTSLHSVFEFTPDRQLRRIPLPGQLEPGSWVHMVDLPGIRVGIFLAERGVFAVDANRGFALVPGGQQISRARPTRPDRVIALRNELMFVDAAGLYVVTNRSTGKCQ